MEDMNTTPRTHSSTSEPGFRDAGIDDLVKDTFRLGPAPNRSREIFMIVVLTALIGAVIAVLRPEPVVAIVMVAAAVVYMAIRWVIGTRTWGAR